MPLTPSRLIKMRQKKKKKKNPKEILALQATNVAYIKEY